MSELDDARKARERWKKRAFAYKANNRKLHQGIDYWRERAMLAETWLNIEKLSETAKDTAWLGDENAT